MASHRLFPALLCFGMLVSSPARAAMLKGPIMGWSQGNVPNYITMYEYVPDKPAANPPVLVVSHYCGGNAGGMFGIASGGGIVSAADKYGFILIFPETSKGCWDVGSAASLTHDGGGDTQAIAEMVAYEIAKHGANANRVYATGQSSGAMMTEALLAVYPDVFKAGAEFSGVPAGCWSVGNPGGGWSGACASGQVSHTAQEWGDMVRAMDPAYMGHRPRIQLWHGTADDLINYNNHLEAIKEWTNVLGLGDKPTSTTSVMLNNHQWDRQSWQDACGFTVLDAWSEKDGPHNTDASENAMYVIPFLGLDQVGPADPDVPCGGDSGGTTSSGGGTTSTGGSGGTTSEGGSGGTAGDGGSGGAISGGNGGNGDSGGHGGDGGNGGSGGSNGSPSSKSGCSCDLARESGPEGALALAGVVALGAVSIRRRRSSRPADGDRRGRRGPRGE